MPRASASRTACEFGFVSGHLTGFSYPNQVDAYIAAAQQDLGSNLGDEAKVTATVTKGKVVEKASNRKLWQAPVQQIAPTTFK